MGATGLTRMVSVGPGGSVMHTGHIGLQPRLPLPSQPPPPYPGPPPPYPGSQQQSQVGIKKIYFFYRMIFFLNQQDFHY